MYERIPIELSIDFSTETSQARRESHDVFKVLKGRNLQPRIPYPGRLLLIFRIKGQGFPMQNFCFREEGKRQ